MILSDYTIKEMMNDGRLSISPMCDETIQPASIDLRISDQFAFPITERKTNQDPFNLQNKEKIILDLKKEIKYNKITSPEIGLPPKCFALATTMEYIKLPNDVGAIIQGRSSIGRAGLFIENAGWVDPGFEGELTLELYNANDAHIMIQAGTRVCQIILFRIDGVPINMYNGKYQGQRGVTGSKIHEDSQ